MTEREVKEEVKTALEALGWDITVFSWNKKMPLGLKGVADYYITHEGHQARAWVEVKKPGEGLRPEQDRWLTRTAASGENVMVVHSAAEVIARLGELGFVVE